MPNGKKTLAAKILTIMEGAKYLQKKGWNDAQKYKFAQEADFIELVKPLMEAERVIAIPQFTSVKETDHVKGEGATAKHSYRSTVQLNLVLVNVDDPKEMLTVATVGNGWDQQDKASYKAMTGAMKYALAKTFLIPTGDDPEIEPEKPKKEEKEAEKPKAPPPFDEAKFKTALAKQKERLGEEGFLNAIFEFAHTNKIESSEVGKWTEQQKRDLYHFIKETGPQA